MLWPPAQHVSTIVPTTASEADVVTLPWLLVDPEGFSHWLLLLPVMEMLAMWKNMAHTYTQNTHHHPPPLLSTGKTWPIASWQRNPGNVTSGFLSTAMQRKAELELRANRQTGTATPNIFASQTLAMLFPLWTFGPLLNVHSHTHLPSLPQTFLCS